MAAKKKGQTPAPANTVDTPKSADEILAGAAKKAANKKRVAQAQKELGAAGSKNFDGYLFPYAPSRAYPKGRIVICTTKVKTLQQLGLNLATAENSFYIDAGGNSRLYDSVLTKPMQYSFITRKGKDGTKAYKREWLTVAVPKDAREVDCLKFVSSWTKKKPEAIRFPNGRALLLKTPKSAAYQGLKPKSGKAANTTAGKVAS